MIGTPTQEVGMNGITHSFNKLEMKNFYSIFFVTFFFFATGLFLEARANEGVPMDNILSLSMVEILVQPERYSGRIVTVSGILDIEGRASHIYLNQSAFDHFDTANNITLILSSDRRREYSQFHGKYVLVTGTITYQKYTFPDTTISQISRLEPLPSRASQSSTHPEN